MEERGIIANVRKIWREARAGVYIGPLPHGNNYFRLRTIDELAAEVNIDAAYLSRVFKRFHHESPYRFLIRLKMGHAASLLLSTRRLVKDIAFELGFENQFHFSRTFKSVYGVSPENFLQTSD